MSERGPWPGAARAIIGRAAKQALDASGYYRRRLRRLTFPGIVTLCYHGLLARSAVGIPFGDLHVSQECFDGHCRLIAETCDPLSLADVHGIMTGTRPLPPRPVVITFDDGYASVLELALPVLERYALPAAVFVCTDPVVRDCAFWFDALARRDGEAAVVEARAAAPEVWRGVAESAVAGDVVAQHLHRPLRIAELQQLADSPLVTIGAHTQHHPTLARLPEVEQRLEIAESRAWLEQVLQHPVDSFAYPFGSPSQDYSPATVGVVRDLGFRLAFSTQPGFGDAHASLLELPRFMMLGSVDATELAHRLSHSWHPAGEAA